MYGKHCCFSAIDNKNRNIKEIYCISQLKDDVKARFDKTGRIIDIQQKNRHEIDALFKYDTVHQGIAMRVSPLSTRDLSITSNMRQILVLDHLTDSHNIGAIWRTADALGAEAIITTRDGTPMENGVWAKNASGTIETLPHICVTNLASTLKQLQKQGFWIIGMDGYAQSSIKDVPSYDKMALVMGAEGKGMRELTKKHCDLTAYLPINSSVESLNVSTATAIALYELFTL